MEEKKIVFLIERNDAGLPAFDFQYELINAIDYIKWLYPSSEEYSYELIAKIPDEIPTDVDMIPVGSVEFISAFCQKFYHFQPRPLNIPELICTPEFAKRDIFLYNPVEAAPIEICSIGGAGGGRPVDSYAESEFFIKSNDKIKGFSDFGKLGSLAKEDKWYFVSEVIQDIESEFRCFVYRDELVDIRQYAGDSMSYYHQPRLDVTLVKRIVEAYKGHSPAYTLDIGVHAGKGSFIIELHNFWSCGLYGFSQYIKLLRMTVAGFRHEVRSNKIK